MKRCGIWHRIIPHLIGCKSKQFKIVNGKYNRDLLFALLRDYLTQMTEMDRKFNRKKLMYKKYGEEIVKLWEHVKLLPVMHRIIYTIQLAINNNWSMCTQVACGKTKCNWSKRTITTLEWERYKSYIIENIIEPYLKSRTVSVASPPAIIDDVEAATKVKEHKRKKHGNTETQKQETRNKKKLKIDAFPIHYAAK